MIKKVSPAGRKKSENKVSYGKLKETVIELDRIAKMLIRRDLALLETREKLEYSLEELKNKNIEFQKKVAELELLNNIMIGREIKMIELKNEIEEIKKQTAER